MIYVDPLMMHGWILRGRPTRNCHMFADSLEELHAFAEKLGMKRTWFQNKPRVQHYDLTPSKREAAVLNGAVELDRRATVAKWDELANSRWKAVFAIQVKQAKGGET